MRLHSLLLVAPWLFASALAAHPEGQNWRGERDICAILGAHEEWVGDTLRASRRWQVQPALLLAIIYHESRFNSDARNPKSSSYGYSQAIDSTWERYLSSTGASSQALRSSFRDSIDVVAWYVNTIRDALGVRTPEAIYLAYHEGEQGFRRKSYMPKIWLWGVADDVAATTRLFEQQWHSCYGYKIAKD